MFVFIQGWLCLVEVILLGTCLFTMDFRPVLSNCHVSSTGESVDNVSRIDDVSMVASAFISVEFDFDQRNTFLLIGLARVMVAVISRRIAAWSLTLTTSSVRFASDGRFVKTRSRQFFSRVFICTICSRTKSAFMFRKRCCSTSPLVRSVSFPFVIKQGCVAGRVLVSVFNLTMSHK